MEILKKGRIANLIDAPLFIVLQDGLWGYIAKKYRIIESDTGLLWMIYTIDDLGKLRLSRCVRMEYDSFLKMINSESLDSPEVILGKLNDAFLKNERTK